MIPTAADKVIDAARLGDLHYTGFMSQSDVQSIEIDSDEGVAHSRKRPLIAGALVSFFLHTITIVSLIVVPYLIWLWNLARSLESEPQITIISAVQDEQPETPPAPAVELVAEVRSADEIPVPEIVEKEIEKAKQKTSEENVDDFIKQAGRLERISDAESVEAMADKFHKWLGTKERASQPAEEEVAGSFDFDSAQIHDVKREPKEDGTWKYICVLVDAEGRTMETELDEIEGEEQYRTFQRLKKFPLAEKVYREIAMPLLDKILQEQE